MNLTEACLALEVSRSGYHDHRRKPRGKRRQQDHLLACALGEEFALSRQTYGSPRLVAALRQRGLRHGKNRVRRLMREQHLHVRQKRRFVPRTTQADKTNHPSPYLLGAQPAPTRPNQAWVTDITYLPTGEGWLYVAAEMDLYSRRIIGWDAGPSLATELPGSALQRALATRRGHDLRDLLHHSDRGCQYTSHTFRHQLARQGITQSMSRAGNCYDNAAIECCFAPPHGAHLLRRQLFGWLSRSARLWATLKTECFGTTIPDTRTQARAMLFDYIETFYNPVRLHSSLNFLSPLAFEKATQLN